MNDLFALRNNIAGREILANLLAQKYVRRGARWLNRHAPRGWYRNCLNGGTSRIHTGYSNEGVLAMSFEYCEKFADDSGYINDGKVLRHFGLPPFSKKVFRLGFETLLGTFKPFEKRYPTVVITTKMLDMAWAELLKDPPAEWRIPYRHPTAQDRKLAKVQKRFSEVTKPSFWRECRDLFKIFLGIRLA